MKTNQPICPKCNGKQVLYKKRANEYWCRRCGEEWKKSDLTNIEK